MYIILEEQSEELKQRFILVTHVITMEPTKYVICGNSRFPKLASTKPWIYHPHQISWSKNNSNHLISGDNKEYLSPHIKLGLHIWGILVVTEEKKKYATSVRVQPSGRRLGMSCRLKTSWIPSPLKASPRLQNTRF